MTVARFTGSSPTEIRETWSWKEIEEFLICLPSIRRFGIGAGGDE